MDKIKWICSVFFLRNSMSLRTFPNRILCRKELKSIWIILGEFHSKLGKKVTGALRQKSRPSSENSFSFQKKINENKKFTIAILFGSASFQYVKDP